MKIKINKIIIVRHGESEGNEKNIIQGKFDMFGLTYKGVFQTVYASECIKAHNPSLIIASPLKRAHESAEIIKKECSISSPIILNNLLEEIDFGLLEGITKTERNIQFKKEYEILKRTNYDYSIFNGETKTMVEKRVEKTIEYLSTINVDCLVLVTHGGFIREFIKFFTNLNVEDMQFENSCAYLIEKNKALKKIN